MDANTIIIIIVGAIVSGIIGWIITKVLNRFFLKARKNKEIINTYEKRLEEKEKSIEKLTREQKKREKEKHRIIQSLKRSGLSTRKLVERYNRPLNTILISYMTQVEPTGTGYYKKCQFVKAELEKYDAKYLGGGVSLIPPTKVPRRIRNGGDLKLWFEQEILKGRYCKLKFLILFDLGKEAFWHSYVPYEQRNPFHFTLGEVLGIEDLFTEEQINRIALGDIIRDGDIAWLASRLLSGTELEIIHSNQTLIENKLGKPSLREFADDNIVSKLSVALTEIGINNPDEVSKAIVNEAKFWHSRLK